MLANTMYQYRGRGLSMGTMVCGWDESGPQIYYVDSDGDRLHGPLFSVGSGSTFAYGVLDTGYSYELETEAALSLAQVFNRLRKRLRCGCRLRHTGAPNTTST